MWRQPEGQPDVARVAERAAAGVEPVVAHVHERLRAARPTHLDHVRRLRVVRELVVRRIAEVDPPRVLERRAVVKQVEVLRQRSSVLRT